MERFRLFVSIASSTVRYNAWTRGVHLISFPYSSAVLSETLTFHTPELPHGALLHFTTADKFSGPDLIHSDLLRTKGEHGPAPAGAPVGSWGQSGPGLILCL